MATEAIINTDGTARPIARMQVVDKETGAKTDTDVYTCARAVTCDEGIDLQTHLETLHGHAEDTTVHLTAEEKRGLETTAGAQGKANAALSAAKTYTDTKAVDLAASMNAATSAKIAAALETAAGEAATKANEARAAAVTEATTIATEKAAAAERASAPALHASQHAADGADPITPHMIGAASNQNLFDNWYFPAPINQEKETEWTTTVKTYIFDRWISGHSNVSLNNDGATLSPVQGDAYNYAYIEQRIENPSLIIGKTVTASALLADNTLVTLTAVFPDIDDDLLTGKTVNGAYIQFAYQTRWVYPFVDLILEEGKTATVVAMKLELGSVQTLAYKDA